MLHFFDIDLVISYAPRAKPPCAIVISFSRGVLGVILKHLPALTHCPCTPAEKAEFRFLPLVSHRTRSGCRYSKTSQRDHLDDSGRSLRSASPIQSRGSIQKVPSQEHDRLGSDCVALCAVRRAREAVARLPGCSGRQQLPGCQCQSRWPLLTEPQVSCAVWSCLLSGQHVQSVLPSISRRLPCLWAGGCGGIQHYDILSGVS
jgi:hypothetical protein